jgi:hypothetical protein
VEREQDHSRREAEAILLREGKERKLVEDHILEMLENMKTLPPPHSQTLLNPPSLANSSKDIYWWQAAKNRLTLTKDPLTPAQQVIQDTKSKEKEQKRFRNFGKKNYKRSRRMNGQQSQNQSMQTQPSPTFTSLLLHLQRSPCRRRLLLQHLHGQACLGNVTGNPGVFQGNPHPYPPKPVPASTGTGFGRYGCGFS